MIKIEAKEDKVTSDMCIVSTLQTGQNWEGFVDFSKQKHQKSKEVGIQAVGIADESLENSDSSKEKPSEGETETQQMCLESGADYGVSVPCLLQDTRYLNQKK